MAGEHERLPRLLSLVPYLQARPGISLGEAAADFEVTEDQLRRDLQLLWMCGLPGHGPGDLIDLSFEGGSVSVLFDAGMSRPLRLTAQEALALAVALRTLAEVPGLTDSDAVARALAKVEAAAGHQGATQAPVTVALDEADQTLLAVRSALEQGRSLRIQYYTAARDEVSDRIVDPLRTVSVDGVSYLEAWCRRAEGLRMFRIDRIQDVEQRTEPARPPSGLRLRELSDLQQGLFRPAAEHLAVTLRLQQSYWWVADYYQADDLASARDEQQPAAADSPEQRTRVVGLHVSDPAWVRALVLGSAGQVDVVDPQWLAEDVRAAARTALAAYQD